MLVAHEWQVTEAADGTQALGLHKPGAYDVIVLDLVMPGLGGLETLRAVRETDPRVPVLVVSGYAQPGTVRAAMELLPCRFLAKPFRTGQLLASIDALSPMATSGP